MMTEEEEAMRKHRVLPNFDCIQHSCIEVRGCQKHPASVAQFTDLVKHDAQNAEVYHSLQAVVKQKYGKSAAAVGDEGVAFLGCFVTSASTQLINSDDWPLAQVDLHQTSRTCWIPDGKLTTKSTDFI